jgi:hypothetical protein
MSIFDPDSFLASTVDSANDTTVQPLSPGEYNAQVEELKFREVTGKDGDPRYILDVIYDILDDGAKKELGREKITVRQTLWLDVTSQGQLDTAKGKNISLGRLRSAAGLNDPGKPFAPVNLKGCVVKVQTTLRADNRDPSIQYAEVKSVGKAA